MITRRRLLASSLLPLIGAMPFSAHSTGGNTTPWRNWSGHLTAHPKSRFAPLEEDDLIDWLGRTTGQIRPVGAGHSFTPLVPTDGHLLIADHLNGLTGFDRDSLEGEFAAGTRLSDMGAPLWDRGQSMFNLPDIDRQTIAGALATSTHGTGRNLKSLSGYVTGMRLVTPAGDVLDLDKQHEWLPAAAVSLGALGIVTRAKFQNRQSFRLRSRTWAEQTESVLEKFDTYCDEWQHFEMMPFLHSDYSIVIAHQETTDPLQAPPAEEDDGAALQLIAATPVPLRGALINSLAASIEPVTSVEPSYTALTNIRLDRFNEMEYSVPAGEGPACLREILRVVSERGIDVTIPLEYRIIDGDDTWLSMFTGGPRVSISVHRMASESYQPLFDAVEPIFWKYDGRPHWGKVHSLGYTELKELYPRFEDFVALQRQLDPAGRMLNPHLMKLFGHT